MYRLKVSTSVCVCVLMCIFVCVSLCLCVRYSANITSRLDTYVYTRGCHQGALVTVMYTAWEDMMPLLMQFILTYATLPKLPGRRFAQNPQKKSLWEHAPV